MAQGVTRRQRVLVTGAAGAIGRAACAELRRRGHHVRGLDRVPMDGVDEPRVADLTDVAAVRSAVEGMETVVHLAATPDDADFMTALLPNNVVGLYHVLEAARKEESVRRVIVTSSCQVVWGLHEEGETRTIQVTEGVAPRNHYAVTKVFAEAMASMYARRDGMSVIVVRPGWLPREPRHVRAMARSAVAQAMYLSPRDAGRFFCCAVEAEDVPFAVLFATSRSNGPILYDLEPSRRVIGYEPLDTYPVGMPYPIPDEPSA